ncbi:MAG: M1 family metallopeptidase, partial [Candidatus Zixiibacteriota bacterium]
MQMVRLLGALIIFLLPVSAIAGDYWQQEVNYNLNVSLASDSRTISGTALIQYINNSPDMLDVLYLKAYPNAIQPDSYADKKNRTLRSYSLAERTPEEQGSLKISELHQVDRDGWPIENSITEIAFDNTIVTVHLQNPIIPGDTTYLEVHFTTVLPSPAAMRMGFDRGVTRAVYWYPQVCVYDHVFGWVNSQYIGWGECYGDYGSFDVTITAPEDQIIAATGVCTNEQEVLPEKLRRTLDLNNFLGPREKWPAIKFDRSLSKTWRFHAENVNDFVFTSSSGFCIDSGDVKGVAVVAYVLRRNAPRWTQAVQFGKESIETYSELFIPYQWPVIRICDAFSGMEYPMLTNCSHWGSKKGFRMLLYHEIGHQWFMGMIGSNSVDRPFLDEGFTTFAEHNAMEKYLGRKGNMSEFTNWYEQWFAPEEEDRNIRGFEPLLLLMEQGFDKPMIYSYDRGREYFPHRVPIYYKSAAMLYSLRSFLGDSLFYASMQDYCRRWLFRHPYENDFLHSMETSTKARLTEYLNQWYYTRYRLDYALVHLDTERDGYNYRHTIKIKRIDNFVAPIDIAVIYPQGDTTFYTIAPEGMQYAKPGYVLLPRWDQFRESSDTYEFTIDAQRDIANVVIDPFQLLMDIDRLNNQPRKLFVIPPVEIRFDNMVYDYTPLDKYALRLRPDLWYDEPNGFQIGGHAHGSYLQEESKFDLDARLGTESLRPTIDLRYSNPLRLFGRGSYFSYHFLMADHRYFFSTAYDKRFREYYSLPDENLFHLDIGFLTFDKTQASRLSPLPEDVARYISRPEAWDATNTYFSSLVTGWYRSFRFGKYGLHTTQYVGAYKDSSGYNGFLQSGYHADLELSNKKRTYLELHVEYWNVSGDPPAQFLRHLSRVPAAEQFVRSRIFRSPGTFPTNWQDDFYLAGHDVRGYQDRLVYFTDGWTGSLALTPPDLLPYRWFRRVPLIGNFLSKANQSFFLDA